jgi:hypothetical protein
MVDHLPVKSGRGEDFFLVLILVLILILLLLITVIRDFVELACFQEVLRP